MKILTVDIGNSRAHLYAHWLQQFFTLKDSIPNADFLIYSSVVKDFTEKNHEWSLLLKNVPSLNAATLRRDDHFLSLKTNYAQSLGADRIVQLYLLSEQFPNESMILVDAGTMTTLDILVSGVHVGGYIFPGMDLYLKTFHTASLLPSISKESTLPVAQLPCTTQEAIWGGLFHGLYYTLAHFIQHYGIRKILFSGGKAKIYAEELSELSKACNVVIDPLYIHEALYSVALKYLEKKDIS
jgi:type III pantothenate kinase